jgi:hypothetical protein
MKPAVETEMRHNGEGYGCTDHDHDLVHELSERMDALWRYDQYIANAAGHPELQDFWRDVKKQEAENIKRLKDLITIEIDRDCF